MLKKFMFLVALVVCIGFMGNVEARDFTFQQEGYEKYDNNHSGDFVLTEVSVSLPNPHDAGGLFIDLPTVNGVKGWFHITMAERSIRCVLHRMESDYPYRKAEKVLYDEPNNGQTLEFKFTQNTLYIMVDGNPIKTIVNIEGCVNRIQMMNSGWAYKLPFWQPTIRFNYL